MDAVNWLAIAEHAYGAYAKSTDNKNFRGDEMPAFADLPEAIQAAWVAATRGVVEYFKLMK